MLYRKSEHKFYITFFFFFENRTVDEIMWKNIVKPERPQMTIGRMRIVYWIPKTPNTHAEYVIFTAFPLQQWLHESAFMLRYTYIVCLVLNFDQLLKTNNRKLVEFVPQPS